MLQEIKAKEALAHSYYGTVFIEVKAGQDKDGYDLYKRVPIDLYGNIREVLKAASSNNHRFFEEIEKGPEYSETLTKDHSITSQRLMSIKGGF